MKPALIAAIVLASAIHLAPRCEAKEKTAEIASRANEQQPSTLTAVLACAVFANRETAASDNDSGQNDSPNRNEPSQWIFVIIAGVTAIVVGWQSWETRKAAQAAEGMIEPAKTQTQHLINSERAWLMESIGWGMSPLRLVQNTSSAGDIGTSASIDVFWSNHGKTPAWVTEVQVKMLVTERLPEEPDMSNADILYGPYPVVPGNRPRTDGHRFFVQADGWAELGQLTAVYGIIKYRDAFTPKGQNWETWFGYFIAPDGSIERLVSEQYNRNS